jgi:hypothetical protein
MTFRAALLLLSVTSVTPARADNIAPLAFGMNPQQVAQALDTPLHYVYGRPRSEVLVAVRDAGVPGFYRAGERIYLQFRNGRLTGWRKDWALPRDWLF